MDIENRQRKKNGKTGGQPKRSNLETYIEENQAGEPMREESADLGRFDSLKTALLQCVQVRDREMLAALLNNDDEDVIENTVADLPAASLEQFVAMLIDKLTSEPGQSRQAVRWLRQTLKQNVATVHALPETLGALRGIQAFILKKEQMLSTVVRMKGKIAFALQMRSNKREAQKEALDLASMKPLLKINGGQIEEARAEPVLGVEAEEEAAEEAELDDDLDDEDDDDEKLYQEAYENEEIDEPLAEGDEELDDADEEELS